LRDTPASLALASAETAAIRGVRSSRVFAGFTLPPVVEPTPGDLAAFITQLLRELTAAVKFGRILQVVGRLFLHLDRTHGHLLVVFPKVWVVLAPLIDLQNEIQLFVQ
jgi:hypothetical protein